MLKIALVTVTLQHYRLSFYEKLTRSDPNMQWTIYHGIPAKDRGRPAFKGTPDFPNKSFKESNVRIGPFSLVFNSGLRSMIKKSDPDVIILPGIAGNITNRRISSWAKKRNKKLLIWSCGWEPGMAKGFLLSFKNHFVSSFIRRADFQLTYSNKANAYIESMGVPADQIRTCYNGIEIDELVDVEKEIFEASKLRRKEFGLEGHVTFLYVGGLIPEKRIDLLLEAFTRIRQEHQNIKLLIIGDGPEKENLLKKMEQLNDDHIVYLGRIVEGVDEFFAATNALVLPGVGGLALNQAMFWGKLCIVSEADGTEDDLVIDGETGFRFIKGDVVSLSEALKKMILVQPTRHEVMSRKAKGIIMEKSNTNHMVEIFMDSLHGIIHPNK